MIGRKFSTGPLPSVRSGLTSGYECARHMGRFRSNRRCVFRFSEDIALGYGPINSPLSVYKGSPRMSSIPMRGVIRLRPRLPFEAIFLQFVGLQRVSCQLQHQLTTPCEQDQIQTKANVAIWIDYRERNIFGRDDQNALFVRHSLRSFRE
jgi:hypothetical protein